MRVLRISAGLDPRHGGPPQADLLSALAAYASGMAVEVATIDEGLASAPAIERLREAGVVVHALPLSRLPAASRFTISGELASWVWANASRFDVIHVHGAWTASSLTGVIVGRLRDVPVVLTPHESMTEHDVRLSRGAKRTLKLLLRAFYFRTISAAVYASEIERRDSAHRARARQVVVPHAVELLVHRRRRKQDGAVRLGFLGRFDAKKNLDVLLRALPEEAELLVAGDGLDEQRQSLQVVARDAGVADRVHWLGFVEGDTKTKFLREIDLLVMPSRYECFGMVAAEALAAGVPVVVTPSSGIAPLVHRHDCGYVVEPQEARLRAVLSRREALEAKASRARSAVETELSSERHASALAEVYRAVAEERI